ncbi:MAG: DUF1080 domain-containing protein [Planctomycetaceae bacterium]|jgi:hypothetical protein|nr:DUF1080 domain-containing protein [Planctomycetaceae bacterium]
MMRSQICVVTFLFLLFFEVSVFAVGFNGHRIIKPTAINCTQPVSLISADGSFDGWTKIDGKPVNNGWEIVDGVLHRKSNAGDIMTVKTYKNFVMDFEWSIAKGGNSGIKYKFDKYSKGGWLGCEYQFLDDANNGEGKRPKHESGALYDIIPPSNKNVVKPYGEVNKSRVIVNGRHIVHYLNGVKVVDICVGSADWKKRLADSKFNETLDFGAIESGHIMVQDHGSEVWIQKLTIRETASVVKCAPRPRPILNLLRGGK